MDAMMPMGFFENTREIYAEVASYPVVPPEKIKQYWNAYTTTFRRLFDPSAFRLENFWWHVWGSDRLRNLSGQELARLFEEISSGPTFVPLPSPADQFKRTRKPGSNQRVANGQGKSAARPQESSDQASSLSSGKRGLTPSSSRPPPPHPILKKSRGPSSSGPRPTARFASPPTSGEEAIHDGEATPTNTAAVAAAEMPPPPLPLLVKKRQGTTSTNQSPAPKVTGPTRAKQITESPTSVAPTAEMPPPPPVPPVTTRTTTNTGRKVVAATAASRRKPVMVRRQSSQSSTGSDSGQRVVGFVAASKRSGSKRTTPTASQLLGQGSPSSQTTDHGLSTKAAGKRKAKPAATKRSTTQGTPSQVSGQTEEAVAEQHPQPGSPQRRSTWDVKDSVYHEATEEQQETAPPPPAPPSRAVPPPVAGFVVDQSFGHGAPPMVRTRSNNSDRPQRLREPGVALLPSQATSSVAMVNTTARGQFDSETVTSEPVVPEARDIPDRVMYGSQPSYSILDQQLKPTPPNPTPPIPFGRSKSELTLLLARDRKPKKGEKGEDN